VIIKFGHTNDIIERLRKHRKRFGDNIKLISIFETKYNREFELIIKKDPVLIKHIIPLENNIYKSVELIQLDSNFTMQHLTKRMDKLKENLKGDLIDNLINENYELKLQLAKYEPESLQQQKLELETKKYELRKEELNCMLTTTSPTIHKDQFRYQIYDPVSLEKIDRAAYKSIGDVCDEKKMFRDAREHSVGAAVKSCKVYKTYRFWRISQTDPDIQYTIPPTVELSKAPKYEQIVKLNSEGNEILGIYSCSEDAANKNKKQNIEFIKNGTEEMKQYKNIIIVILALFYLLVILRIIILYLVPNTDLLYNQIQQNLISYVIIIKIILILMALSVIPAYYSLKKNLTNEMVPI